MRWTSKVAERKVGMIVEEQPVSAEGPPVEPAPGPPPAKKSTRKKVILSMSIALVILLLAAGLSGSIYAWRFLRVSDSLTIGDVDISRVPDGAYAGSYSVFHVKAAVEVSVEGGRITAIGFTDSGRIAEETQQEIREIFDEVIASQSLDVDVTSGASVSKKVSLKAVEDRKSVG